MLTIVRVRLDLNDDIHLEHLENVIHARIASLGKDIYVQAYEQPNGLGSGPGSSSLGEVSK
jgi:hypothetical protein